MSDITELTQAKIPITFVVEPDDVVSGLDGTDAVLNFILEMLQVAHHNIWADDESSKLRADLVAKLLTWSEDHA